VPAVGQPVAIAAERGTAPAHIRDKPVATRVAKKRTKEEVPVTIFEGLGGFGGVLDYVFAVF